MRHLCRYMYIPNDKNTHIILAVLIVGLGGCLRERVNGTTRPFLEEGIVAPFFVEWIPGGKTADVGTASGQRIERMRINFFTTFSEEELLTAAKSANGQQIEVYGYIRAGSEGIPGLGPDLPNPDVIQLPGGPGYFSFQEIVIMSLATNDNNSPKKKDMCNRPGNLNDR